MRHQKYIIAGGVATLLIALAITLGINEFSYRFTTAATADKILYIPSGATFEQVVDSLSSILEDKAKFRRIALRKELPAKLRSGRYVIKAEATYASIIGRIKGGMQTPVRVTFNNIRTMDRLAGAVSKLIEPDSLTMLRCLTNDSLISSYGFTPQTFIAMFVPDTYELYWNTSPEKFVERMSAQYQKFWNAERQTKLKATGLSQVEAATLASIVYEETKMSDEMPTVVGVYMNRLRIGMPLQADPTVKFAIGDFALRRILTKHLSTQSPYNTYLNRGLPPGPICMPSIKAIDAVLDHKKHKYLYFCARPDFSGYHNFAENLPAHNQNARTYAKFLNSNRIYK